MMNNAYNAYAQNNIRVESPEKLVEMMYEGVLKFASLAKKAIENNDIEKKVYWLNRTSEIFIELASSLDYKTGGDIAIYLNGLYAQQLRFLTDANINDDTEKINIVLNVTKELLEAWREIH